jgi:recombination protein RecA
MSDIDKIAAELSKDFGAKVFKASEAPPVKVISTGITSLDVATGIGGFPRGTLVEVYGRESAGKTALALYTMAEVHRNKGFTALVNLESNITQEGWLNWAEAITPSYFDPARLLIINPSPGSEALIAFSKLIASGAFDLIAYDSIGAMSTDKELRVGEAKQAYGQSALVTQLIKQAALYAYDKQCVAMVLNQIRDDAAGTYILEKAPGGHAKDHFATLRIHLKTSSAGITAVDIGDGAYHKERPYFRVNAKIKKNKVGAPRRAAGWNYWDYRSPDGVLGIDTFQDTVDVALRRGMFERRGAWFYSDVFPDGKLNGGVAVSNFLRANPDVMTDVRKELVMKAYNNEGNVMDEEAREVLTDAVT